MRLVLRVAVLLCFVCTGGIFFGLHYAFQPSEPSPEEKLDRTIYDAFGMSPIELNRNAQVINWLASRNEVGIIVCITASSISLICIVCFISVCHAESCLFWESEDDPYSIVVH